jgi:hypothetical protein
LNMSRIAAKFVHRLLTNDQKSGAWTCVLSYERRSTRIQLLSLGW